MKPKKKQSRIDSITSQTFFNNIELSPVSLMILFGVIAFVIVIYMIGSPRPYDDDNIGRYFMAQAALDKPEYFINMWGRPLAILFFLIPAQLGYWFSASATALLTLGTCYFTYLAAKEAKIKNSWLAIIFLIFQPLFLITSYSLCTEPLAAFLLALGLYFYYKESWNFSALALALMPLARTELTLLLPIFAFMMIRKKQWIPFVLLGSGLLLFQITGMLMTGDYLFLLTASKSFAHGLYPNGPFSHYFERFIFIVGPVIFIFMMVQLILDIRFRRLTVLNSGFLLIFIAQVYFYWKGNVASIGFLRHFVGISPIMALLALEGFNRWFQDVPANESEKRNNVIQLIVLSACALIILIFYSFELIGDYFLSNEKEYLKFAISIFIVLLFVLNKYLLFSGRTWKYFMMYAVVMVTFGYTVIKEKPTKLSAEQQAVKLFQNYYSTQLTEKPPAMMIVHPYFFFFDNFNYYRDSLSSRNYVDMRLENLSSLPVGSLIAWDAHYSWRLSSNVELDSIRNNKKFDFKQEFLSTDKKFAIYLFKKVAE
jgi:hypothetical protein